MVIEGIRPEDYEVRSLEIVEEKLKAKGITLEEQEAYIIKKCILSSGDLDYAENMRFSEGAKDVFLRAIKEGCHIMTDSKMVQTGILKPKNAELSNTIMCFSGAEDVIETALRNGVSPAYTAMERALLLEKPILFVIGEEAEAILSVLRMYEEGELEPVGIIASPAGFLNVDENKSMIMSSGLPYIITKGSKGGSHIASAIVNAIMEKI